MLGRAPHPRVREAARPWKGAPLGGPVRPVSATPHPSTWSGARRRDTLPRRAALPRTGAERGCGAPTPVRAPGTAAEPPPPLSLDPTHHPSRAYPSWRCTRRTTQLKSHPLASLPRVLAQRGAWKPGGNGCAGMQGRVGLRGPKLAGGRRGSWLGGAGCCARGSRPGRRPRPPRPAPSPPPTADGDGAGLRPRSPLRMRSPRSWGGGVRGSSTPAGCAPRWDLLVLPRPGAPGTAAATSGSPGAGVLGPAVHGEEEPEAPAAPPASRAAPQPSRPRRGRRLRRGAALGAAEVATVHPGGDEELRSPRGGRFFPRGTPGRRQGARPAPLPSSPENGGIRSGNWFGRGA